MSDISVPELPSPVSQNQISPPVETPLLQRQTVKRNRRLIGFDWFHMTKVASPAVLTVLLAACVSETHPVAVADHPPGRAPAVLTAEAAQSASSVFAYKADPAARDCYNSQGLIAEVGKVYPSGNKCIKVFHDKRYGLERDLSLWFLSSGVPFLTIRNLKDGKVRDGGFAGYVNGITLFVDKGGFFYTYDPNSDSITDESLRPQTQEVNNRILPAKDYDRSTSYLPVWMSPTVDVWRDEIKLVTEKFGKDPRVVAMFVTIESFGDPDVISKSGAMGLVQHMPATWNDEKKTIAANPKYVKIAQDLGVNIYTVSPYDPIANLFFTNCYLDSLFPDGPIPADRAKFDAFKQKVKMAGWRYNGGLYTSVISSESALYMEQLDEMLEAVYKGDTDPLIAQGFSNYYLLDPRGNLRLENAVNHIKIKGKKNLEIAQVRDYLTKLIKK